MRRQDASFADRLQEHWFLPRATPLAAAMRPISMLFALLAWLRRIAYRLGLIRIERIDVPVVVVGNITVGGTGKTPLVVWLTQALRSAGRCPGIVLRGYRAAGGSAAGVREVGADSEANTVGDEAVLLARRTGVPVFTGKDRPAAARALRKAHPSVDVIVSDDGLQHYALGRDVEIAVFDRRATGNRLFLPAGPLREPVSRLATVDAIVCHANGREEIVKLAGRTPLFAMHFLCDRFVNVHDPAKTCSAAELLGRQCFAIAGTGSPQRFFDSLVGLGIIGAITQAFPDHHAYSASDLAFAEGGVLLMTEKDAVKCAAIAHPDAWYLPVSAAFDNNDGRYFLALVMEKIDGRPLA